MDLALFALAPEYVDDRTSALRELRRVLRSAPSAARTAAVTSNVKPLRRIRRFLAVASQWRLLTSIVSPPVSWPESGCFPNAQGGVSRMSDPDMIEGIISAVTIPVMSA